MSGTDLTGLMSELPDGMVVTDPDILAGYRQDRAADPTAGTPLALVRPTTTAEPPRQRSLSTCASAASTGRVSVSPLHEVTSVTPSATSAAQGR